MSVYQQVLKEKITESKALNVIFVSVAGSTLEKETWSRSFKPMQWELNSLCPILQEFEMRLKNLC
jgi:hypothetical protein